MKGAINTSTVVLIWQKVVIIHLETELSGSHNEIVTGSVGPESGRESQVGGPNSIH